MRRAASLIGLACLLAISSLLSAAELAAVRTPLDTVAKVAAITTRDGSGRAQRLKDAGNREFAVNYDAQQRRTYNTVSAAGLRFPQTGWPGYERLSPYCFIQILRSSRAQRFTDTGNREFVVKYDTQRRVQAVEATCGPHISDIVSIDYAAGWQTGWSEVSDWLSSVLRSSAERNTGYSRLSGRRIDTRLSVPIRGQCGAKLSRVLAGRGSRSTQPRLWRHSFHVRE